MTVTFAPKKVFMPLLIAASVLTGGVLMSCRNVRNGLAYDIETLELKHELKNANDQVKLDSMAFEQADSILAKQKMAEVLAVQKEYYDTHPLEALGDIVSTLHGGQGRMDSYVNQAQREVDIATGKVLEKSRHDRSYLQYHISQREAARSTWPERFQNDRQEIAQSIDDIKQEIKDRKQTKLEEQNKRQELLNYKYKLDGIMAK